MKMIMDIMKRTFQSKVRRLRQGACLATIIGLFPAAQAATIGLNFPDDWGSGGGADVTEEAFGVPAVNWYNLPRIFNSNAGSGVSSNTVVILPEGGALQVEWSCVNTYSLAAEVPTDYGDDQVIYGYLDDTGTGYRVRLSGFRDSLASYSFRLIASTDNGEGFTDASLAYGSDTNLVQYVEILYPSYAGGIYSVSSASSEISTLATNNSVVITGSPRQGTLRSTLAAILIDYTPGGSNPPLLETEPELPTGTVYVGSPLRLSALASGSAPLAYQWRLDGIPIAGATDPTYSVPSATLADSGAYDLVVTNSFGATTSLVANVTISAIVTPQITSAPASQALYTGYPATFTVEATGGQLAYQWRQGTMNLLDATNASLVLPAISGSDQGTYTVTVSNASGSADASADLAVLDPGAPYATAIAASKPLVYFRLSETGPVAQATATNRGSLGIPGTGLYVGAYSLLAEGALVGSSDTAVTLSGGRVAVGYDAALNPAGSFTVECWAKPSNVAAGTRVMVQSMINGENADNANDRSGWVFRQNGDALELVIGGEFGAPFYTTIVTVPGQFTAEAWNHYAAVYDSETLSVSLLVNGVEVTNVIAAEALLPNFAAPLLVGDRGYGGWTFQGTLDEVALYSTRLTPTQLLAHYQAGTNAATSANYPALVIGDGAVEYLRLDDAGLLPSANAATNNGTLGAAWTGFYSGAGSALGNPLIAKGTVGPRPEPYVGLEPANVAVAMTNGWVTSPPLGLGNQVTAIVWINRQEISTTGDLSWPAWLGGGGLHLNNGSASNPDAELRYHWNGGEWGWSSGLYVPPDVWTFVAFVVEPDQATIYMSEGSTLLSAVNTVNHAPMIVTSPPGFGGNQPGRADRNYLGQLDEVAVYDRSLSPEEVTAIFNSAFSSGPVPPSTLTLTLLDGEYFLNWTEGVLQSSDSLTGTFSDVDGATSPYPMIPDTESNFYRLRSN